MTTPTTTALQKISAARHVLREKFPFFEPVLYALCPIEMPSVETMGVTARYHLVYNAEWVGALTQDELTGVLMHEIAHAVGYHWGRLTNGTNERDARIAKELTANSVVIACGLTLPDCGHFPKAYGLPEGLSCEAYYELLQKPEKEENRPWTNVPGIDRQDVSALDVENRDGEVDDGGGAEGAGAPLVETVPGLSAPEIDMILDQVRALAQNQIGTIPGELQTHIKPPPPQGPNPWKRLRYLVRATIAAHRTGNTQYSRRKPSRIGLALGVMISGRVQKEVKITVVLDTSGSMTSVLKRALQELYRIFEAFGVKEVTLIQADAAVQDVAPFRLRDLSGETKLKGFGGTDFTPAILEAIKQKRKPDVIIYVTDGYGALRCPKPRGVTVIWAITPGGRTDLPWGEIVDLRA